MRRLHRVTRASFGKRTNGRGVTEQFRQRDLSVNDGQISTRLDAVHLAPAPVQVADNVALIFVRGDVFYFHDRLEQDRFGRSEAVFHREDRCHFERELVRIDFVETAVNNVALNIDNWIAAKHAVEHGLFDTFFNGRDVFARDNSTNDFVFDDQSFASFAGPQINFNVTVLTAAARLFD